MSRTTFVIETTGGSPVFHIPVPLSLLTAAPGSVKYVFRNRGGNPTFHVGGAEVGVSAADAWDYGTVVRGVREARIMKLEGTAAAQKKNVDVRAIKTEEGTPRISRKDKGKEQDIGYERRPAEADCPPEPTDPPVPRNYEEVSAILRGSLTPQTLRDVYERGKREFALQCAPTLPPDRTLNAAEEAEYAPLWEALLKLDRLSAGPERDIDALKRRSDEMVAAAVARVRARENEHPGQPSDATSLKRRRHGQAANQEASSHDRVPTPSPEQVVATVRKALRPLHSALLVQANTLSAGVTHDNDKDSDKGNDKSNNKGDENGSNTVARARQFKAWLQGMGAPPEGFASQTKMSASWTGTKENPTKRARPDDLLDPRAASTKRAKAILPPPVPEAPQQALTYTYYRALIPRTGGLTHAETAWLAAQGDLARPPGYFRPVRWLELGLRMAWAAAAEGEQEGDGDGKKEKEMEKGGGGLRPLHHGVLLRAWDAGTWRFPGHERVGRPGVPWAEWVVGAEGRVWRGCEP
ncbi:hypothetical protein B0H10DRAFT_2021740 [Mycena sp. CBHHK59/15]|nr:hypothetical protein B0H10DRAFT_2021740 [Mycena sp. CBHHK59/15]